MKIHFTHAKTKNTYSIIKPKIRMLTVTELDFVPFHLEIPREKKQTVDFFPTDEC